MPTLNINGNIRTNTAAGWGADATVYTAKTILVTTDATYGATDQRKFKIADGTQTWSNLDYFPVSGYDDATSSIQNQLYRSFSPFESASVISHTGTTAETVVYTSSPDLVGKLISGDMLMIAGGIQATNNANAKTLRFYISDSQSSLSNEVLIGTVLGTTNLVNTLAFDKLLCMTSISTQNVILGTGNTTATGASMGTTAIDFSSGSKYLVATLQLASGTDTVKIQFGRSTIHRG
jgi:hypothetical protein